MAFSDEDIKKVWEKGSVVPDNDADVWRKDQCGAWIGENYYGDRNSQYGWEIDHITPESDGGSNDLSNLRPLQWKNNAEKQDGKLSCPAISSGINNIEN